MSALAELNGHAQPGDYAQAYRAAGLSPIPIRADGSKAPEGAWKRYQTEPASEMELGTKFLASNVGIGICYGSASDNAELIDFDEESVFQPFADELDRAAPGLRAKLCIIQTPRPGRHAVYRCERVEGNQKVALRYATAEELQAKPTERVKVKIETRGQGGYALAPGGDPNAHPSGRPYKHIAGPPLTELSTITVEEREVLFRTARLFNEVVEVEPEEAKVTETSHLGNGSNKSSSNDSPSSTPGDDFNARASWEQILAPHGWTKSHAMGDVQHWTRPGKDQGTSATTGLKSKNGNELLCVFSTSAHPFPGPGANGAPCSTHTKFGAYCLLNHDSDFAAAARQLGSEGYGDAPQRPGMPNWMPADERDHGDAPGSTRQRAKAKPTVVAIEPYQPFPLDSLPEAVSNYIDAAASAIGCDASFIALPTLACLARAIGNTRTIRLKRTWAEPAIIWAAIIGKSGTHKTPALMSATQFLQKRQAESIKRYEEAMAEFERDKALHERNCADWKKQKNTTEPPPCAPVEPTCTRFITTDVTIEALADRLASQYDGILIPRDELAGWLGGMAEYKGGKGSDLGHWLAVWSGASLTVDRKTGAKKMLHVPRASVSIVGGIQPAVLRSAIGREHMQDGLCARLLMAMPDSRPVVWTDDVVDEATEAAMADVFDRLLTLEPATDPEGNLEPCSLPLTPEAKLVWIEFFNRHRAELAGLDDDLAAAWSKLEAYAARFGLIFQLCSWAAGDASGDEVDQTSIEAGIVLADWFGREAKRVYGLFVESETDRDARELADLIRRKGGTITARDLAHSSRRYRGAGEAESALNALAEAGVGKWVVTSTATNQRREFTLNPAESGNGFG